MAVQAASLETIHAVVEEVSQVVIGQAPLIQKLLIALLADGHVGLGHIKVDTFGKQNLHTLLVMK